MKKTHRKQQLRLARETVRNLSQATLSGVAGGISIFLCGSETPTCTVGHTNQGFTCASVAKNCDSGNIQCDTANCTGVCDP